VAAPRAWPALVLAAAAARPAGAVQAAAPEADTSTRIASASVRDQVARFCAAFAARGDADGAEAMEEIARSPANDPFEVAHGFLVMELESGEERLAAALRHAQLAAGAAPGLPALVAAWSAWDEEQRLAERDLQQALGRARLALKENATDDVLAGCAAARGLVTLVPESATAVLLERVAAFAHFRRKRWPELVAQASTASERARSIGWTRMEALGELMAGEGHRGAGAWEAGTAAYERALSLGAGLLRPREEGEADYGLGACLAELGRGVEAPARFERAAESFARAGDAAAALASREQAVLAAVGAGRHALALAAAERWLAAARAAGVARDEAFALWHVGLEAGRIDRFDVAVDALEQTIPKLEALGRPVHAGGALLTLAEIRSRQRRPEATRALLEQARSILAAHPDERLERDLRDEEASFEEEFGDPRRALAIYEGQLARAQRRGEAKLAASYHAEIADLRMRLGEWPEARLAAERSFAGYRELGDAYGTCTALGALGNATAKLGDVEHGHSLLQAALAIAHELEDPERVSFLMHDVARLELALERHPQAARTARRAAEMDLDFAAVLPESDAYGPVGWARRVADVGILAAGRWIDAAPGDPAAVDEFWWLVEATRAPLLARRVAEDGARRGLVLPPEVGELRERAQALRRDLVAAGDADGLRARTAELRHGVALAAMDAALPTEALSARARDFTAACLELETALARLEREQGGAATPRLLRPLARAEVQALLPAGTVVLIYAFATPGESEAFVLALDPEGCEVVRLGLAPERIRAELDAWAALVDAGGSAERSAAARLHDALLRPLAPRLLGKERIVVVPDGWLGRFPFEAFLRVEGGSERRAIEEHEFVYAPSATALARMVRRPESDARDAARLVAAGDPEYAAHPRLPATRDEVAAIAALWPEGKAAALLGAAATRASLRRELEAAPAGDFVLHVACHGAVDPVHPLLHGVVLGGDELFALSDLVDLDARAALAVLSCCETGLGRVEFGENDVGWAHELLEAGVPRVVVADWRLDDARTAAFMARFHSAIRRDRLAPAAALRRTKLEWLRSGGAEAQPRVWAPFVLWGRWD